MLKRLRLGFSWSYVLLMAVWLLARSLVFDGIGWVSILNYIAIYLFIPLPILLIPALFGRQWPLVAGLSIPIAAFGALYGMLFLPSLPQQVAPGQDFTVMTFNLRLGNQDYLPLAAIIRTEAPDIVGIQEFVPGRLEPLITELIDEYPYSTHVPGSREVGVVGILSKLPIRKSTAFALPGTLSGIDLATGKEFSGPGPRFGISAEIQMGRQPIQVVSVDAVHNPILWTPITQWTAAAAAHYIEKIEEIDLLEKNLIQNRLPFLLLCDCNLADTSEFHARLADFSSDSFQEKGWGFGHTLRVKVGGLPIAAGQRMDYIWHSPEFTVLAARVGQDSGSSDHFPVVAKLVLSR